MAIGAPIITLKIPVGALSVAIRRLMPEGTIKIAPVARTRRLRCTRTPARIISATRDYAANNVRPARLRRNEGYDNHQQRDRQAREKPRRHRTQPTHD